MTASQNNLQYERVFSFGPGLDSLVKTSTLQPFSDVLLDFIDSFSRSLLKNFQIRQYPELVALGFWMRRSNLLRLREQSLDESRVQVARGTVFHVAPSNVDTIFVYSWFLSLLCGNRNIVRISSKASPQIDLLLQVMGSILAQDAFLSVRERTLIVRYGHEASINELFSACCDLRAIWGGDSSIRQIRQAAIPPTSCEMTFADKFSLCVIEPEAIMNAEREELLAWVKSFYNDTFWFGQMACSSPRMVLWCGNDSTMIEQAQEKFWGALDNQVAQADTAWDMADYVNKRVAVDSLALDTNIRVASSPTQELTRVWLNAPAIYDEWHCGVGLFHEAAISSLEHLLPILSRKVQTISYIGISPNAWREFLRSHPVAGIDRIVPVGQALEFGSIWDGYDMPRMFMREVSVN